MNLPEDDPDQTGRRPVNAAAMVGSIGAPAWGTGDRGDGDPCGAGNDAQ
nr:hypothetical protein JVH1_8761 [Rhodococcus sp. JVH1]